VNPYAFAGINCKQENFTDRYRANQTVKQIPNQAEQKSIRVATIQAIYEEMKRASHEAPHTQYTACILDATFSKPIFRSFDLAERRDREYGIHEKTVLDSPQQKGDAGVLRELQSGSCSRPSTLGFPRLLKLGTDGRFFKVFVEPDAATKDFEESGFDFTLHKTASRGWKFSNRLLENFLSYHESYAAVSA
jgi:hypothetical protein